MNNESKLAYMVDDNNEIILLVDGKQVFLYLLVKNVEDNFNKYEIVEPVLGYKKMFTNKFINVLTNEEYQLLDFGKSDEGKNEISPKKKKSNNEIEYGVVPFCWYYQVRMLKESYKCHIRSNSFKIYGDKRINQLLSQQIYYQAKLIVDKHNKKITKSENAGTRK